jgi:hypothetical protein
MVNHSQPTQTRPSFADAIKQVQKCGAAEFLLATGQVAKLTRTKLLQNYAAILRMAGIEQTLGESIGLAPGSGELKIADAKLSRYADVPAYWVLPLGELVSRAAHQKSIPHDVLGRIADLKVLRDAVMHGEADNFGQQTRKSIRQVYEMLLARSRYTPTQALRTRIEAVEQAKNTGDGVEEMLSTLGTLYRAIESEVEIRAAMKEAGIYKGDLPLVESIFELKRASGAHRRIFTRDNLTWKFRASALVRNHLVHGSIIVPSARQTEVVNLAYQILGQTLAEICFRKNGGVASDGDFRNSINL